MDKERRKKIVVPVVLLLGIFIGGAIVLRTGGISAALLDEGRKITYSCLSDPNADCDHDGLKNWQEEMYHTDPNNPDTDGDGYLDGEEVASGYDPTIPAPNDALPGTDKNAPRPLPKNLTTQLAQILTQKISSGEITPAQGDSLDSIKNDPNLPYNQDLMDEALAQIGMRAKENFTLPEVKVTDIKVSSAPTTYETIGTYIVAVSQAVSRTPEVKQLNKSEFDIIADAVKNKNTADITLLHASVQKNIENIKNVVAPQGFENLHAQQIALLMLQEKIFDAVAHLDDDPAMAAAAIETYPQFIATYQAFSDSLNAKIQSYQ